MLILLDWSNKQRHSYVVIKITTAKLIDTVLQQKGDLVLVLVLKQSLVALSLDMTETLHERKTVLICSSWICLV